VKLPNEKAYASGATGHWLNSDPEQEGSQIGTSLDGWNRNRRRAGEYIAASLGLGRKDACMKGVAIADGRNLLSLNHDKQQHTIVGRTYF
jgi:hypothetical protein